MWFTSRIHLRKTQRNPGSPNRFLPQLEVLEDRTLPSTLTVLNTLDSGAGSLRATITAAKNGDTIAFAPSLDGQTITLTSGELAISKSLAIEGPGASLLAISGNNAGRIFDISQNQKSVTVTIAGLTIEDGLASTSDGGGIVNISSTLNLSNDALLDNASVASSGSGGPRAAAGGAISNRNGGILIASGCTFLGNRAIGSAGGGDAWGGAIANNLSGFNGSANGSLSSPATIIACTFRDNMVQAGDGGDISGAGGQGFLGICEGGAIFDFAPASLTIHASTFVGNHALAGNNGDGTGGTGTNLYELGIAKGGAVSSDDGSVAVDGCSFSSNLAVGGSNNREGTSGQGRTGHAIGGAISLEGGVNTVSNSTFDHNQVLGGNNNIGASGDFLLGRGAGGAIGALVFDKPTVLTISNCAFTNNLAVGGSGNSGGPFAGDGIGGGFMNERGVTSTVTACTFTDNQAIGGADATGANGANGLGGGIANILGSTLTVSGCMLSGNQAIGGAGGGGGNGGNGLGGGIYNDGLSVALNNAGTPATLTVTGTTITDNQATGGAAGTGGSIGQGIGGGAYFAAGGDVCLDLFTETNIDGNSASTSNNDLFGTYMIC